MIASERFKKANIHAALAAINGRTSFSGRLLIIGSRLVEHSGEFHLARRASYPSTDLLVWDIQVFPTSRADDDVHKVSAC